MVYGDFFLAGSRCGLMSSEVRSFRLAFRDRAIRCNAEPYEVDSYKSNFIYGLGDFRYYPCPEYKWYKKSATDEGSALENKPYKLIAFSNSTNMHHVIVGIHFNSV